MSTQADAAETGTDEILAEMERTAFAACELEIPLGGDIKLPRIRKKKCACCGGRASRSVYDLRRRERRLLCGACR
jgi:hypothetical protein